MRCWCCRTVELTDQDRAILAGTNHQSLLSQPRFRMKCSYRSIIGTLVLCLATLLAAMVCSDTVHVAFWLLGAVGACPLVVAIFFCCNIFARYNLRVFESYHNVCNPVYQRLVQCQTREEALHVFQARLDGYQSNGLDGFIDEARAVLAHVPESLLSKELSDLLRPYCDGQEPFPGTNANDLVHGYPPESIPDNNISSV